MNIEEVEAPQKYENLQTKPVLDPFKSTAEHRKVRELARKMNIEEVEEPETTKIYRPNPLPSVAATPKLRKFTDETNIQARNHENSDEICAQPVRHLDLATRAFTTTVRTPSVTTLFGETLTSWHHDLIQVGSQFRHSPKSLLSKGGGETKAPKIRNGAIPLIYAIPSLKQTVRNWKLLVGRLYIYFPFGFRPIPIFSGFCC